MEALKTRVDETLSVVNGGAGASAEEVLSYVRTKIGDQVSMVLVTLVLEAGVAERKYLEWFRGLETVYGMESNPICQEMVMIDFYNLTR